MRYRVRLSAGARLDLLEIGAHISNHNSPTIAVRVIERLEQRAQSLAFLPNRGTDVIEATVLGLERLKQIIEGSYRVIYRVNDDSVEVLLIIHTRRNLGPLLAQKLLDS